ncbi:MAG: hypothetical protein ACHP8B_13215 [Terriglobales bacterium]
MDPKDWGGESNDIFTTRITVGARRRRGAFALKGPAKVGPLVPRMMGKNGDQIQRLFSSPAQVFFVQYEGEIKESVVHQMSQLALAKAATEREVYYGVIDLKDIRVPRNLVGHMNLPNAYDRNAIESAYLQIPQLLAHLVTNKVPVLVPR